MTTVAAQSVCQTPPTATVRECMDLTAAGRILAIATNPRLVAELGSSMALLVYAIQTCDGDAVCRTTCAEVAERCDVHVKTVQNWLAKLDARGLVTKTPRGVDGVEIKINVDRIGEVKLEKSALSALAKVQTGLIYGLAEIQKVFANVLAESGKALS